jgi:hypothetical protein
VAGIIAFLIGGSVATIIGYGLKTPFILTAFGSLYAGATAMVNTLLAEFLAPLGVASTATIVGVVLGMMTFLGCWGALQLSGSMLGIGE